jgi:hypothetical protein
MQLRGGIATLQPRERSHIRYCLRRINHVFYQSGGKEGSKCLRGNFQAGTADSDHGQTKTLKLLICQFAEYCQHQKILRKVVERPHHFVTYPIIPGCRADHEGVPIMESDLDLDEEDEKPDEPLDSNCHAIFAYNTIINNALIK